MKTGNELVKTGNDHKLFFLITALPVLLAALLPLIGGCLR
jgi:hypothetical protein